MDSSSTGESSKDSKEGSNEGDFCCLDTLQGAAQQDPCMQGVSDTPVICDEHLFPTV